jgi:two-component system NarL family sensor kinase
MVYQDIKNLILISTVIFLIGPVFIFLYIFTYYKKRRRHLEEKSEMKAHFETELLKTQMEVREQTMEPIGADLHDNIGQLLSLVALTLNSIEPDQMSAPVLSKIDSAVGVTMNAIEQMRLLGKLLQGEQLISWGLKEAISQEINYLMKLGVYEIKMEIQPELPTMNDADRELIIFRMFQESINNIIKHARTRIICIRHYLRDRCMILEIEDFGKGFDTSKIEITGIGLSSIRKRAEIIGAVIEINSIQNTGTKVIIKIPYQNEDQ